VHINDKAHKFRDPMKYNEHVYSPEGRRDS